MYIKCLFSFLVLILCSTVPLKGHPDVPEQQICGKWISSDKSLVIQVYTEDNKFKAKIAWFKNTEGKPIDYWTDQRNPDKSLRNRKLIEMDILRDLNYQGETNTWENGKVYDSTSGREWNASAYIDNNGQLRVRGYWHFKWIGRTMTFNRV